MERLTILQVGDIHFPDHNRPDADVKDVRLSPSLVGEATTSELQIATRALLAYADRVEDPLLVVTGDLTSKGDLAGYGAAVNFLEEALLLSDASRWPAERVHVVPGNHDVNRALAAAAPPEDLYAKFAPLADAWLAKGLSVIATDSIRRTDFARNASHLHLFGLNSCLGCGEQRALPGPVRDELGRRMATAGLGDDAIELILATAYDDAPEVVDTPAFSESHVDELCEAVRAVGDHGLAAVVAHHNVLQQALPRFDLYTDLVNAGMLRSRLSSLKVPVLYLHGHIHSDPVEFITQFAPDDGQLVCISAPEFHEGFNQIDIAYTDLGVPVGCVVRRVRLRLHGGASEDSPVRIRFQPADSAISPLASEIATLLLADPGCASIADAQQALSGKAGPPTDTEIAGALEEVEWLGLVEIMGRDRALHSWRLRAVVRHG